MFGKSVHRRYGFILFIYSLSYYLIFQKARNACIFYRKNGEDVTRGPGAPYRVFLLFLPCLSCHFLLFLHCFPCHFHLFLHCLPCHFLLFLPWLPCHFYLVISLAFSNNGGRNEIFFLKMYQTEDAFMRQLNPHKAHLASKLKFKTVLVVPSHDISLIFHFFTFPGLLCRIFLNYFLVFLAIFILLSSNNNNINSK